MADFINWAIEQVSAQTATWNISCSHTWDRESYLRVDASYSVLDVPVTKHNQKLANLSEVFVI